MSEWKDGDKAIVTGDTRNAHHHFDVGVVVKISEAGGESCLAVAKKKDNPNFVKDGRWIAPKHDNSWYIFFDDLEPWPGITDADVQAAITSIIEGTP